MEYCSNSAEETEALGAELAVRLRPGDVVAYTCLLYTSDAADD